MRFNSFLAITGITILLSACQTSGQQPQPATRDNAATKITPATISMIEQGRSTRNDVIELLGPPNIITQSSNGGEIWHFSKMSTESTSQSANAGTGLLPGLIVSGKQTSAFSTSSSKTTNLQITFSKNGIVESYKSVSSQF